MRALLIAVVLHAVAQGHVPVASRNRMAVEVAHLAAVEYTVVVGIVSVGHARVDLLHVVGPVGHFCSHGTPVCSPPREKRFFCQHLSREE